MDHIRKQLEARQVLDNYLSSMKMLYDFDLDGNQFVIWISGNTPNKFTATLGGDPESTLLALEFTDCGQGMKLSGSYSTAGKFWSARNI